MKNKINYKNVVKLTSIYFILIILNIVNCLAQSSNSNNKSLKFEEGVYLDYKSLLSKQPSILKNQLLIGNMSVTSIRSWSKSDSLYFKDSLGIKKTLKIDSVWSIYENGNLYIQHNRRLLKINNIGSLSFFNESYEIIKAPNSPIAMDQSKDIRPYIADFSNGNIYDYSIESFEKFMQNKDEELYKQFIEIKKKKKKREMIYHFIEMYNTKHPLF